jgi:GntR family transcriptional regulator, transcriptional repressor for pyruvate dehydrogenase complex
MAPDREDRAERKADSCADDLLQRIVAREIEVGSILPKEAELAEHYNVARSVVREAIKLLEVHGLVRPTKRLGTVVLDPLTSTSPEVVRAMLVRKNGYIDLDFFAGWLEVRAAVDAQMCELAALRRNNIDISLLDEALDDMRIAAEKGAHEDFNRATQELAFTLAHATHNPLFKVLARWHARVVSDLDHVFRTLRSAASPHVAGVEMMLEAIRRGDAATTKELVTTFHTWATPRLIAAAKLVNGDGLDVLNTPHVKGGGTSKKMTAGAKTTQAGAKTTTTAGAKTTTTTTTTKTSKRKR